MGQADIREKLVELHTVISGKSLTCEEIVKQRRLGFDMSLVHHTELHGKVASGSHVPVEKYGSLEDKLDYGTSRSSR